MNLGQGELGFGAWPSAKSAPVAEYCTVFRVSTPMAFVALLMTVLASCAEAVHTSIVASARPVRDLLSMFLFLSVMPCSRSRCAFGHVVRAVIVEAPSQGVKREPGARMGGRPGY